MHYNTVTFPSKKKKNANVKVVHTLHTCIYIHSCACFIFIHVHYTLFSTEDRWEKGEAGRLPTYIPTAKIWSGPDGYGMGI